MLYILLSYSIITQAGGLSVVPSVPGDSTPFVIKVDVIGLQPGVVYDCGVWLYGKPSSISQLWTDAEWKGGYRYVYFISDSTGSWHSYKKMRVVKSPDPYYDYYMKCTIRDTTGYKLIEDKYRHSDGFNITDVGEIGYMEGNLYSDSSLSLPLEDVILFARDADGNFVGGYISENNLIDEDYEDSPGYFRIGLPSTTVTSLIIEDSTGISIGQITGEWEVPSSSTLNLGRVFPYNIVIPSNGMKIIPSSTFPGEVVQINLTIQNTGQASVYSLSVFFHMDKRGEEMPLDSATMVVDSIPGLDNVDVNLNWVPIQEGNYVIRARAGLAEGFARLRVGDPVCELVINEIMCYPDISEDWIELYNSSDTSLDLKDYRLESAGDIVFISREHCLVGGESFVIICDCGVEEFRKTYGYIPPDIEIIALSGRLPELRGTSSDTVSIIDRDGFTIDEVRYGKDWIPEKGISMERIGPSISSNIPSNWGGCVEEIYGATPGRDNSLYSEYTPKGLEFSCTEVFCPSSEDRVCYIEYHLPFNKAHVRLYVYDRIGRLVRRILDGDPTGSASYSVDEEGNILWTHIWDGKGDDGSVLPMGSYLIYLEAQSVQDAEVISGKIATRLIKDMR